METKNWNKLSKNINDLLNIWKKKKYSTPPFILQYYCMLASMENIKTHAWHPQKKNDEEEKYIQCIKLVENQIEHWKHSKS